MQRGNGSAPNSVRCRSAIAARGRAVIKKPDGLDLGYAVYKKGKRDPTFFPPLLRQLRSHTSGKRVRTLHRYAIVSRKPSGSKGILHPDPEDPPRRRANQARGHGTWESDRPPVLGIVGRESGQIQLILKKQCTKSSAIIVFAPLLFSAGVATVATCTSDVPRSRAGRRGTLLHLFAWWSRSARAGRYASARC